MTYDPLTGSLGFVLGDGSNSLPVGTEVRLPIDYRCVLTGYTLAADATGSLVIDLRNDTFANYPPTGADSICGGAKPTLASANRTTTSTLSGWTTTLNAGDVLAAVIESISTIKRVTLVLRTRRI